MSDWAQRLHHWFTVASQHVGQALCAPLSDQQGWGSQPPTPTTEPQPLVQAGWTRERFWQMARDDAVRTQLLDYLEAHSGEFHGPVLQRHLAYGEYPYQLRIGDKLRLVWLDNQGCSASLDIHQCKTKERWHRDGKMPTCSHGAQPIRNGDMFVTDPDADSN